MIEDCPYCGQQHHSKAHDLEWYFACCELRLLWREVDGVPRLHSVVDRDDNGDPIRGNQEREIVICNP